MGRDAQAAVTMSVSDTELGWVKLSANPDVINVAQLIEFWTWLGLQTRIYVFCISILKFYSGRILNDV